MQEQQLIIKPLHSSHRFSTNYVQSFLLEPVICPYSYPVILVLCVFGKQFNCQVEGS